MDEVQAVQVGVLIVGLVGSVAGLVAAATHGRRHPDDRVIQAACSWLAALSLMVGLGCCVGLSAELGDRVPSSPAATAVIIVVNLLAQPVAAAMTFGAPFFLVGVLRGRIPRTPTADPSADPPRGVVRYCVFLGLVMLASGLALSFGLGWPLLQWALA